MSDKKGTGSKIARCNFCLKSAGKKDLKKCSGCHLVMYCSEECQRKAWSTHKSSCAMGTELRKAAEADPDVGDLIGTINKWLSCWRATLMEFGITALDLPNSPPDRLATHTVFIELERRDPRPSNRATMLRMCSGSVFSREELCDVLRDADMNEEHIENWKRDNRGDHTLQVNLMCEGHFRSLWVSFRNLAPRQAVDKKVSKVLSKTWARVLRQRIELGRPMLDSPDGDFFP